MHSSIEHRRKPNTEQVHRHENDFIVGSRESARKLHQQSSERHETSSSPSFSSSPSIKEAVLVQKQCANTSSEATRSNSSSGGRNEERDWSACTPPKQLQQQQKEDEETPNHELSSRQQQKDSAASNNSASIDENFANAEASLYSTNQLLTLSLRKGCRRTAEVGAQAHDHMEALGLRLNSTSSFVSSPESSSKLCFAEPEEGAHNRSIKSSSSSSNNHNHSSPSSSIGRRSLHNPRQQQSVFLCKSTSAPRVEEHVQHAASPPRKTPKKAAGSGDSGDVSRRKTPTRRHQQQLERNLYF